MRRTILALALAAVGLMPMPATAQTTYKCLGETATIVGTEEDDTARTNRTLWGTFGDDVMVGLGGSDLIFGGPKEDSLSEVGDDTICGGEGSDSMVGFGGKDVLVGGAGNDDVDGWSGADRLMGGNGEDNVYGRAGHDSSRGGPGNDRLIDTSTGADELYGDGDDDTLDAANRQSVHKPDFVDGGDGRDVCKVNEEDEVVNCEDVFVIRP